MTPEMLVLYVLGAGLLAAGVIGLVVPALPGGLLLVAGTVVIGSAESFQRVGWPTITIAVVLAVLMTVVDFCASLLGARKMGASRWGLAGASVGFVLGLPLGLPGLILGPALGAFALEYFKDPRFKQAAMAGTGVAIGFVLGTVGKLALAALLLGVVALALFV